MNVIFDVDETLYNMTQPFERAFKEIWQDKYDIDMYELYTASRIHSDRVFDQVMAGTMTVDGAGVYRMQHAMRDFGFEITEEEALEFQHVYRKHQQHLDISKTMERILNLLKERGVSLAILTNGETNSGAWDWNAGSPTTESLSPMQSATSNLMCALSGQWKMPFI